MAFHVFLFLLLSLLLLCLAHELRNEVTEELIPE